MQYYRSLDNVDSEVTNLEIKRWWQDVANFPEVSKITVELKLQCGEAPHKELEWSLTESPHSLRAFYVQNLRALDTNLSVGIHYMVAGPNRSTVLLQELIGLISELVSQGFVISTNSKIIAYGMIPEQQFWAKLLWSKSNTIEHSGYRPPQIKPSTEDGFRRVGGWCRSGGW